MILSCVDIVGSIVVFEYLGPLGEEDSIFDID